MATGLKVRKEGDPEDAPAQSPKKKFPYPMKPFPYGVAGIGPRPKRGQFEGRST